MVENWQAMDTELIADIADVFIAFNANNGLTNFMDIFNMVV